MTEAELAHVYLSVMAGKITEVRPGLFLCEAKSAYGEYTLRAQRHDWYAAIVLCHRRWITDKAEMIDRLSRERSIKAERERRARMAAVGNIEITRELERS